MKAFIRRLLGLEQLDRIEEELVKLRSDLSVTFFDESHPTRQELSSKLGERAIQRMIAEDKARRLTERGSE